jgi:hypothetical protein
MERGDVTVEVAWKGESARNMFSACTVDAAAYIVLKADSISGGRTTQGSAPSAPFLEGGKLSSVGRGTMPAVVHVERGSPRVSPRVYRDHSRVPCQLLSAVW